MRSSSVFVLATLAIGQAAAAGLKHASFHARRSNIAQSKNEIDVGKRAAYIAAAGLSERDVADVDWTKVDWSAVDWSKVNYGGASSSSPAPVPSSPSAVVYSAKVTPTPTPTPTPISTEAAYTPTPTPSPSAKPSTKVESVEETVTGALLEAADKLKLLALGFIGVASNPTSGGNVFISDSGPYHAEVTNDSGDDIVLVCWEGATAWVNAHIPSITLSIGAGSTKSVSFSDSFSGACSTINSDTKLVNGMISNTWWEMTTGTYGTYDVSKEVNMSGHGISIVGPSCTSDMTTCVFECGDGSNSCQYGYKLVNCANGSQKGATFGSDPNLGGADSGGCSGMGDSATLKVTLS